MITRGKNRHISCVFGEYRFLFLFSFLISCSLFLYLACMNGMVIDCCKLRLNLFLEIHFLCQISTSGCLYFSPVCFLNKVIRIIYIGSIIIRVTSSSSSSLTSTSLTSTSTSSSSSLTSISTSSSLTSTSSSSSMF